MQYDPYSCILTEELDIIVLQPKRNKYLKWKLPSPQTIAHLFQENTNSFVVFQSDCTAAIRNSHYFIQNTTEIEIRKATAAIWKSAEESVKREYHKLNLDVKKLIRDQGKIIKNIFELIIIIFLQPFYLQFFI